MIGNDAVDFLWHALVEVSQTCLHMRNRDVQLCSSQRTCQGGVGIAIDNHSIETLFYEHLFNSFKHATCLSTVWTRTTFQVVVRSRDFQFLEELGRHIVVVMLSCMYDTFLMLLSKRATDHSNFDELGTRPHN